MVCVAGWLLILAHPVAARDPWYVDVGNHWARPYIRVLWDESITDGWVLLQGSLGLFQPNEAMTRAQYAVQLGKVFRLDPRQGSVPYEDVLPDLVITGGKPAYAWIAAAFEQGILPSSEFFYPHTSITREDATALLVNALGLNPYIEQLSPLEVSLLLSRFADHHVITESLRPAMAAATKLGIIQGYDDGMLRPKRMMTRAEAITIICRSCILLLDPSPAVFSPDGDGIDETTTITVSTLRNRNITRWNITVIDEHGAYLHSFNPSPNSFSEPPTFIVWDGRQGNGQLLPPNVYFIRGWVRDSQGMLHWSVPQPVEIREYRLWGHIAPRVSLPGSVATLNLTTNHPAERVTWREDGDWFSATKRQTGGGREWTDEIPIPLDKPDGPYAVMVRVEFPREVTRQCLLPYDVFDDLAVLAWLTPTVIMAGDSLVVRAETSEVVTSVTATFMGHETKTMSLAGGVWEATWTSPTSLSPGSYGVEVVANAPGRERKVMLSFTVIRDPRLDVTFIIID